MLLDIANLTVEFTTSVSPVRAVDDVSLSIGAGEIIGLVGESILGEIVSR